MNSLTVKPLIFVFTSTRTLPPFLIQVFGSSHRATRTLARATNQCIRNIYAAFGTIMYSNLLFIMVTCPQKGVLYDVQSSVPFSIPVGL